MAPFIFGNPGYLAQPAARAPMPAAAVQQPMPGLLGANPAQTRADAFLRSLGAMAPGLLMAGAPSTDPGQRGKGLAMAFQAQPQAFQQDLARVRAENVQNINLQMARAKAAREKALFNQKMARHQMINNLLGVSPVNQAVPSANQAVPPAGSLSSAAVSSAAPVKAAATNQSQVRLGNVAVPQSVIAAASLTDDVGGEISKYVQKTLDPANKFTPLGELTAAGRDSQERSLRDTLKKPLQEITGLETKGNAINAALDRESGLGDLAAINSYQRLIDPAVVRGEDVELIAAAKPIGEYFETFKEKLRAGKKLGPNQRKELREAARDFIVAKNKGFVTRLTNVKNLAVKDKLRWDRIWLGPSIASLSGQPAAKPKTAAAPTAPLPTSRNNAPKVGSPNSRFTLPNPVTGN
jgi:hypothetical protein